MDRSLYDTGPCKSSSWVVSPELMAHPMYNHKENTKTAWGNIDKTNALLVIHVHGTTNKVTKST